MCYTVGPCWLSILNIAVCTFPSQTLLLSLPRILTCGNHKFVLCESLSILGQLIFLDLRFYCLLCPLFLQKGKKNIHSAQSLEISHHLCLVSQTSSKCKLWKSLFSSLFVQREGFEPKPLFSWFGFFSSIFTSPCTQRKQYSRCPWPQVHQGLDSNHLSSPVWRAGPIWLPTPYFQPQQHHSLKHWANLAEKTLFVSSAFRLSKAIIKAIAVVQLLKSVLVFSSQTESSPLTSCSDLSWVHLDPWFYGVIWWWCFFQPGWLLVA